MHWSVSPYFFCVYICLCKKAYHLLRDQPLPMAPPLLLLLPLLPPLPPSLRPLTQVSAWFSSAKPPPPPRPIFQHRPCSLLSAAPHHLTAVTKAWSHLPNEGCIGCTTNSLAWSPLLSLTNILISDVWNDSYSMITRYVSNDLMPKTINNVFEMKEIGEGSILRLFGAPPACCTSPANHPAATCLTMPFTWLFYQEQIILRAFSVRVASVGTELLTCTASVPWST